MSGTARLRNEQKEPRSGRARQARRLEIHQGQGRSRPRQWKEGGQAAHEENEENMTEELKALLTKAQSKYPMHELTRDLAAIVSRYSPKSIPLGLHGDPRLVRADAELRTIRPSQTPKHEVTA